MDVVVDVSVNTVPVSTSVTFTLYSRITPLVSSVGGADHDREIVVEFKLLPVRFCGEALAAVTKQRWQCIHVYGALTNILIPASSVCTVMALLNGPLPAFVSAAIEQAYIV